MKTLSNKSLVLCSGLAAALTLLVWSPLTARSGDAAEGKMMEHCQQMMDQKQKMSDDIRTQDDKLMEQVSELNRAPDAQKLALMTAVVSRMAEQRASMNQRRAKMDEKMMTHMMRHMQMGAESMSHCPMMKGGKDADGKSTANHKEHHPETK